MRPPEFWKNPPGAPGWEARVLAPVAAITARATARRVARAPGFDPPVPVICVGNIGLGGAGKTPATVALSERIAARGHAPFVVTRGYGGSAPGPLLVAPERHRAAEVGDEALLHAAFQPTIVARDRAAGARLAVAQGADVILLDDGHQNPSVRKSLSVVVVDAARGFGNGCVFPAGPLRETVASGLARADVLVTIGGGQAQQAFRATWADALILPQVSGRLEPLQTGMDWVGLRVLAFAGIGDPGRFFATLDGLGATRIDSVALDDHQPIADSLFARLARQAQQAGAQLVCTEKDAVRLSPDQRPQVLTVPVRLRLDDWQVLDVKLDGLGL